MNPGLIMMIGLMTILIVLGFPMKPQQKELWVAVDALPNQPPMAPSPPKGKGRDYKVLEHNGWPRDHIEDSNHTLGQGACMAKCSSVENCRCFGFLLNQENSCYLYSSCKSFLEKKLEKTFFVVYMRIDENISTSVTPSTLEPTVVDTTTVATTVEPQWGGWTECSVKCGGAIQTRQQVMIGQTAGVGAIIEKRVCGTSICIDRFPQCLNGFSTEKIDGEYSCELDNPNDLL